jgi:hypothetical protein
MKPLSRLLEWAVWGILLCNVASLILLPFVLAWRYGPPSFDYLASPSAVLPELRGDYAVSLTVFYLCGLCTLAAMWQCRGVLKNTRLDSPFTLKNALYMRRVAWCCFLISGFVLVREIYLLTLYPLSRIIWYYNTLFIPFFAVAGLFCLLLAECLRKAAELREDNSLVI